MEKFVPTKDASQRTKNRFKEHDLIGLETARFLRPGEKLFVCEVVNCGWRGWIPKSEIEKIDNLPCCPHPVGDSPGPFDEDD